MKKTFKYRLYPTKQQKTALKQTLDTCRVLYNHLLHQRQWAYKYYSVSLSYTEQQNDLPDLKAHCPALAQIHSQVLQNVAKLGVWVHPKVVPCS